VKLGIISDVHSNLEALEAVLGRLREKGATRFVCCGDIVGYGPNPNECVELVRGLKACCVAGNHDWGAVGRAKTAGFNDAASAALDWTRRQLTESNRIYLGNLALAETCEPMLVVHGSASAPERFEYVLHPVEADDQMGYYSQSICVAGHTHSPLAVGRVPGEAFKELPTDTFRLRPEAKYFINAGSVGQPRDSNRDACAVLFDVGAGTMTFLRVPYDVAAVQKKMAAAGLPASLAARLGGGY
jgi:predicted phosphodiesterase